MKAHRELIERALLVHGALLFRDFGTSSLDTFQAFVAGLTPDRLRYVYRSTPRTEVADGIYTATEYPPGAEIPLHNENSYSREWPMTIMFGCLLPAATGGETTLAETGRVTRLIASEILNRFEQLGVLYVRNYHEGVDLPWEVVFQTTERSAVEEFCRAREIGCQWLAGGRLCTRQVCQGVADHPRTGQRLWFNQAHLFHVSSLDAATRDAMSEVFSEEELPRAAFYGDGTPLEPETLDHIRKAFEEATVTFSWKEGDLLVADNMLVAHGRRPFKGQRRVLVAMANRHSPAPARPLNG